jgi:hypothetical protein
LKKHWRALSWAPLPLNYLICSLIEKELEKTKERGLTVFSCFEMLLPYYVTYKIQIVTKETNFYQEHQKWTT